MSATTTGTATKNRTQIAPISRGGVPWPGIGIAPCRRRIHVMNQNSSATSATSDPTKSAALTRHQVKAPISAAIHSPTAGEYHPGVFG